MANSYIRLLIVFLTMISALGWEQIAFGLPYLYVEEPVPFLIERPTVRTFFSIGKEKETRTGPFTNAEKDTATTRQKFDIRTRGWVYHPALVFFNVGLRPEFKQQTESAQTGFKQEDDAEFLGYFIDTTWLQYKPYTINLFSSKDRSDLTSTLAADTTTETDINRASLMLKYKVLPTTMTLESRETVTEGFFQSVDAVDSFRIESKHKTDKSRTTLKIETREQDRKIGGSTSTTDRFTTYINNSYHLSDKSNLSSGFSYSDSSSELRDTELTRLSGRLKIRHKENFSTQYAARIENRDETDFSSDSTSLSAGLTHQLYENLTTAFNVNSTTNKQNSGDLNTYGANLDFRYRRRIPWGMLNMNLGFHDRIEDDQRTTATAEVRDESHTFVGLSTQIFLDNTNIDTATIVVTDNTGLTTYVLGVDYFIDAVGTSVRITRDPFAGIGDDQEVLVDYSHTPDPPAKTGLRSTNFGVNLFLWDRLTLFYQRGHSKERLISGAAPDQFTDDTVQRAGAEYKYKWSTTRVEVEDRDTTRTPLRRLLVQETLAFRPRRNLSFGLGAAYTEQKLKDTGEVSEGSGANANLTWSVGRGQFRARAFIRRNSSTTQRTESKGLFSIYDWRFGAWRPSIRYEFLDDINEISGDTRERQVIYFQIERTFD